MMIALRLANTDNNKLELVQKNAESKELGSILHGMFKGKNITIDIIKSKVSNAKYLFETMAIAAGVGKKRKRIA
jgi:hypothetical protein